MGNSTVLLIAGVMIVMLLFTIRIMLTMASVSGRRNDSTVVHAPSQPGLGTGNDFLILIVVVAILIFIYSMSSTPVQESKSSESTEPEQVTKIVTTDWKPGNGLNINVPPPSQEIEPDIISNYYTVQVEATKVRELAYETVEKFGNKYPDVHIVETAEEFPFKIVIGRFSNLMDAKQLKRDSGIGDSFVREVSLE